jgi:hypothetical protein
MKYFYHQNGIVNMISDGPIETSADIFELQKINISSDDEDKIKQGYKPFIKDKKLILENTEAVLKAETLDQVDKAKSLDELKNILKKII